MLKHLYQAQVLSFHLFMSVFVRQLFVMGEFMKLYYDAIVPEYYLQEIGALFTTISWANLEEYLYICWINEYLLNEGIVS